MHPGVRAREPEGGLYRISGRQLDTGHGLRQQRRAPVRSGVVSGKCEKDSTLELVEVSFCGSASPEGGFAINRELAENAAIPWSVMYVNAYRFRTASFHVPRDLSRGNASRSWSRCPTCPTRKRRWTCCATCPNLPIIIKVYWLTAARNT